MMNRKSCLRLLVILLLTGLMVIGLTACKLPASKGPQTGNATSEGFPVPGETQPTSGGIDVSAFATQTAQAKPPVVVTSTEPAPAQNTPTNSAVPVATDTSQAPEATSTPITYVEPLTGTIPLTYTLQDGDFPFCIARRFNVNQSELLQLNNITSDSLIGPGTVLKIPQTGDPFEGERSLHTHPDTYTVQEGDTIYSVACYYGDVSPEMIIKQNNLKSTELTPGTELVIP